MKDKKHLGHEAFFNLSSGWRDSLGHQRQPWNGPTVNEKDDFCARPWSTLCSPTKEGGSLILTGTGASPALMIRFPTFPLICPTQCSVTVIYNYHHSTLPSHWHYHRTAYSRLPPCCAKQIRLLENGADDYMHFPTGKNSSRSSADTSRTANPQVDKSSALNSEHPAPAKHITPFLKSFGNKESSKGFKYFEVTTDNINAC